MHRRAQFYMIDAFFAAAILFLGIGLLVSEHVSAPQQHQTQAISESLAATLFTVRIGDLSNAYITNHHAILDEYLTPAQQVHVWLYNASTGCAWCAPNATDLLDSIIKDLVEAQHGVEVRLENGSGVTVVYSRSTAARPEFMIVNQQILVSAVNETLLIGPDIAEVRVWQ